MFAALLLLSKDPNSKRSQKRKAGVLNITPSTPVRPKAAPPAKAEAAPPPAPPSFAPAAGIVPADAMRVVTFIDPAVCLWFIRILQSNIRWKQTPLHAPLPSLSPDVLPAKGPMEEARLRDELGCTRQLRFLSEQVATLEFIDQQCAFVHRPKPPIN